MGGRSCVRALSRLTLPWPSLRNPIPATPTASPAQELALNVNPIELLGSQYSQMSAYFKSDKLRALFSYQELYVGLSPYNAPGVFSLLAATELTDGVWYPVARTPRCRRAM